MKTVKAFALIAVIGAIFLMAYANHKLTKEQEQHQLKLQYTREQMDEEFHRGFEDGCFWAVRAIANGAKTHEDVLIGAYQARTETGKQVEQRKARLEAIRKAANP